jgi:glycosyltransferase involved in cell wall biosynthesis
MAAGVPAVTTANGGIEDTLSERNGIKVNVKDYKALADAIIRVKSGAVAFDPEAVRQSVAGQYGRAAFAATTLRLYEAVAEGRDRQGTPAGPGQ